jgi:hypothetical protein
MPLPEKEDLKCYIFIAVMIFLIALATFYYYYIIRFVLLIVFYWFVSIPLIIICLTSIDFTSKRLQIKKAFDTMNSVEYQEYYKEISGENALKNGKPTKSYKNWMTEKVAIPKYKIKTHVRFSPGDINGLILIVIILAILIIIFLMIYAAIFPDYRIPTAW